MEHRKQSFLFFFLILFIQLSPLSAQDARSPLAVYLTWQQDPTKTMTVQWITDMKSTNNEVHYQKTGDEKWLVADGSHTQMPRNEPFLIHRAELKNLDSGATYYFTTGETKDVSYKFRTMPASPDKPFRFVVGGDMFGDEIKYMIATHKQAAKANPMFALLGGDIAYAANKTPKGINPDEGRKWLVWLKAWNDYMVTEEGYMIPFVPAIGNHDTQGRYNQSPQKSPYFYSLFAFPGAQGYNVLDFGNYMTLVVLDTDHTHPIQGNQTQWLSQTLSRRKDIPHKFALYHVGAYPSVRKYSGPQARKIRQFWVPNFEAFGLSAAFEHHDHAYKRTYPIYRGKRNPDGVLYIGDGAWGPSHVRKPRSPTKEWYLAFSKQTRNFIMVTIDGMKREYRGIDPSGNSIDSYSQTGLGK